MSDRKKGLTGQQQAYFDIHYMLEDMDSIRRDMQRIASALEELCANSKA